MASSSLTHHIIMEPDRWTSWGPSLLRTVADSQKVMAQKICFVLLIRYATVFRRLVDILTLSGPAFSVSTGASTRRVTNSSSSAQRSKAEVRMADQFPLVCS